MKTADEMFQDLGYLRVQSTFCSHPGEEVVYHKIVALDNDIRCRTIRINGGIETVEVDMDGFCDRLTFSEMKACMQLIKEMYEE